MDWSKHYPAFVAKELETDGKATESNEAVTTMCKKVEVADIGCGFGGLLFALAPKMPDTLILGSQALSTSLRPKLTLYRDGDSSLGDRVRGQ